MSSNPGVTSTCKHIQDGGLGPIGQPFATPPPLTQSRFLDLSSLNTPLKRIGRPFIVVSAAARGLKWNLYRTYPEPKYNT